MLAQTDTCTRTWWWTAHPAAH
ncbi:MULTISPECIES: trp operon leader peptide [Streptomyces]